MLTTLIGLILFPVFLSLSAIHFYWALGGKWGAKAAVPAKVDGQSVLNPTMLQCFVIAFGLLGFGLFILVKSRILIVTLPIWLLDLGAWALALLFIFRSIGEFKYIGFFKKVKTTDFGQLDSRYYSPLCLAIGLLLIALALTR